MLRTWEEYKRDCYRDGITPSFGDGPAFLLYDPVEVLGLVSEEISQQAEPLAKQPPP